MRIRLNESSKRRVYSDKHLSSMDRAMMTVRANDDAEVNVTDDKSMKIWDQDNGVEVSGSRVIISSKKANVRKEFHIPSDKSSLKELEKLAKNNGIKYYWSRR